jgi:hypothetical protein
LSHVKHRLTIEQRLAVQTIWAATTKQSHSPDFIAVIFDLSRPTVLEICADTPRLGDKFTDPAILRAGWEQGRLRKLLPVDDASWTRAVAEAQSFLGERLAASSDACVELLIQTQGGIAA